MAKPHQYSIGLDLGGTKLAAALVRDDAKIIDFIKVPLLLSSDSHPKASQKRVINLMADLTSDIKKRYPKECSGKGFLGVGLASAGPMNVEEGALVKPANFPGWKRVPLRQHLTDELRKRKFNTTVHFQNDAIAAAYAEGHFGGAKKMRSYAVVTVGTGIGSGVILNGKPCQSRGAGSEFGHTLSDLRGVISNPKKMMNYTVEGTASGTGLLRRARELGFSGNSVEELVLAPRKKYQHLFDDMAWALAQLCYNLSIGFHLDGIFVSGGLIKVKELYFDQMKAHYELLIDQFNPQYKCPIRIAKTKNNAGFLGASRLPYLEV